jgi:hypothetical protein
MWSKYVSEAYARNICQKHMLEAHARKYDVFMYLKIVLLTGLGELE